MQQQEATKTGKATNNKENKKKTEQQQQQQQKRKKEKSVVDEKASLTLRLLNMLLFFVWACFRIFILFLLHFLQINDRSSLYLALELQNQYPSF